MEKKASEALLQEPVKFYIHTRGFLRFFRIKRIPFKIYPLVPGTMVKISGAMEKLNSTTQHDLNTKAIKTAYELIGDNAQTMSKILAYAVINSCFGLKCYSWLYAWFFYWHLTNAEMETILAIVIEKTDIRPFISSIVFLRGLNVLSPKATTETSPNGTEEIIASGV